MKFTKNLQFVTKSETHQQIIVNETPSPVFIQKRGPGTIDNSTRCLANKDKINLSGFFNGPHRIKIPPHAQPYIINGI